jgi:hypothetical protein
MFFALSRCGEGDLALALKLALDLAQQGFLIPFNRQQHVGPLGVDAVFSAGLAPVKNACVVCRASAWIKVTSISKVMSSSYCYAEACG